MRALVNSMKNRPNLMIASVAGFAMTLFAAQRFAADEGANIAAGVVAIIGIVVAVLVFSGVAPSIASGLNDTKAAFTGYSGVSGVINVLPIVLVVSVLLFLFLRGS